MDTFSVQPTLTKIWGGHTARAGYEFRYQKWNITNAGYPAGRFQFNGVLHPREQRRAAPTTRPQSWAQFLLGLPTVATNTVASAGAQSSQFEIASPAEYIQDIARPVPAGRLAGQQPADAQRGRAARDQHRPARVAGSSGRAVRLRHAEPDRGGGAGRLRRQPDSRAAAECIQRHRRAHLRRRRDERHDHQAAAARSPARTCSTRRRCSAAGSACSRTTTSSTT